MMEILLATCALTACLAGLGLVYLAALRERYRYFAQLELQEQKHTENMAALKRQDEAAARAWAHTRAAEVTAIQQDNQPPMITAEESLTNEVDMDFSGLVIQQSGRFGDFDQ